MSMEMLKSIHRKAAGISNNDQLMAPSGLVGGGDGNPAVPFPDGRTVAAFQDFLGASDTGVPTKYADIWTIGFSDTGQSIPPSAAVAITNGAFRLTSSATSTQTPEGGVQCISGQPIWKANQGRLRYGSRLKIATLAGNSVFAGFTDTGGCEMPAYDTGGGILTPAADYAGFICSGEGGATQQAWRLVAGKAGVDQSATTNVIPVANTYNTLEVAISQDGNVVTGYIDGKAVASISSAGITPTVALSPTVMRANTDGAANAVDIDWIGASAARDTGT
jgi:hypothetical protein